MQLFRWLTLFWLPLYFGGGGPSKSQKRAQKEQQQLAQEAADREISREESLKVRILARQRARRLGQFGRRSLAFNPGAKDLTGRPTPAGPNPAAPVTTQPQSNRQPLNLDPEDPAFNLSGAPLRRARGNITTSRATVRANTA